MRRRRRAVLPGRSAADWSRPRMLGLLIAAALTALLLVAGLVVSVADAVRPAHHATGTGPGTAHRGGDVGSTDAAGGSGRVRAGSARDALAARPMPSVDPDAAHPGPVSVRNPGPAIMLAAATSVGPAGVPTGFPPTPAGAMAQLAAIDTAALGSGSLPQARAVIAGWALPGGPTASSWSVITALAQFLSAAGLPGGGDSRLALVLTPLMGQVKGSVGTDFTVPCVDFEVDVTLAQTVRGAVADCQRMAWTPARAPAAFGGAGGRWLIGPGSEPAVPPSVWPDTDTAIRVGYRDLIQERPHA